MDSWRLVGLFMGSFVILSSSLLVGKIFDIYSWWAPQTSLCHSYCFIMCVEGSLLHNQDCLSPFFALREY